MPLLKLQVLKGLGICLVLSLSSFGLGIGGAFLWEKAKNNKNN